MNLVVVSVAGSLGAVARYLVSGWVQGRTIATFPTGTLMVNLTGAFLLGLIVGNGHLDSALAEAGAGFLGGFTTFSTWMVETLRLGPVSARALLNLTASLIGGLLLVALGFTLAG
jgi:CrcB protein